MAERTGPSPGPWRVEHPTDRPHPIVRAADGTTVCEVQWPADAELIAQVPEIVKEFRAMQERRRQDCFCPN